MKGTHHSIAITRDDDGKWIGNWKVEECPELNTVESFVEGGFENEVNSPIFGGKATVSFKQTGDNKCLTKIKSAAFGESELVEEYTEEGATYTTTHKGTGKVLKEFWPRKVKTEGWFRMVGDENMRNYMKAQGMDIPLTNYWVHMQDCPNGVVFTEIVNGYKNVYHTQYDVEQDYEFKLTEGGEAYKRRIMTTKLSPWKTLFLATAPDGRKEEWTHKYCSKGLQMSGLDKTSGQTCKLFFEPDVNFSGTYKNVVIIGMEDFAKAAGMPDDVVSKIITEFDARLILGEKDGYVTCKYNSKYMPMNFAFKYGEEFTMSYPGVPGTYKCLETRMGDTYINVSKGPKFTTRTVGKITDNYLVQETVIMGTDIKTKQVMERVYE